MKILKVNIGIFIAVWNEKHHTAILRDSEFNTKQLNSDIYTEEGFNVLCSIWKTREFYKSIFLS